MQVQWTVPTWDGGTAITGYTATANPSGQTCTASATTCVVPGLTNGTAYTFVVTAQNAIGASPNSSPSAAVVPRTVPGAPTAASALSRNASALVSWSAPASNGGATITSYTAFSAPGLKTCTTSGLSCTVPGLTNGVSYTFTVKATNVAGMGAASNPSNSVVPVPRVLRYSGPDRFATAAAISAATFAPGADVAYIANAYNFPDALAGAAAAGTVKGPVLLAAIGLPLNPATIAELTRLQPKRIVVLGGTGAISDAVKAALEAYTVGGVTRLSGPNRFATAAAISAATFAPGADVAYIANAYNFPDALAGAAAAGTVKGPVLLAAIGLPLNPATIAELTRLQPKRIVVLGGTGAISDAVKAALEAYTGP